MAFAIRRSTKLLWSKPSATTFRTAPKFFTPQVRFASSVPSAESLLKKFNPARQRDLPFQKPKLRLYSESGAFAHALFAAAADAGQIEAVEKDLLAIKKLAEEDKHVHAGLTNISSSFRREEFLRAIFNKIGASTVTKQFLAFLAVNNYLSYALPMIDDYVRLAKSWRKEIDGVIISARPLSPQTVSKLTQAMTAKVAKDEKVSVTTQVDPTIVGGLVIKIGDTTYDFSLKSELSAIEKRMTSNIATHFDRLFNEKPPAVEVDPVPLSSKELEDTQFYADKKYETA